MGPRTNILVIGAILLMAGPAMALSNSSSTDDIIQASSTAGFQADSSHTQDDETDPGSSTQSSQAAISADATEASTRTSLAGSASTTHGASASTSLEARSERSATAVHGETSASASSQGTTVSGEAASSNGVDHAVKLKSPSLMLHEVSIKAGTTFNDASSETPSPPPSTQAASPSRPAPQEAISDGLSSLLSTFALNATPALAFATVGAAHVQPWLRGIRRVLPLTPGLGYYTRLNREEALEHETRAEVYDLLTSNPGLPLQAISEALDASRSTVRHHVKKLEEMGMVDHVAYGRCRLHFPKGRQREAIRRHILSEPMRERIHTLLQEAPASVSELAKLLEANPGQIHHHLGKLCESGLAERRENGSITYHATQESQTIGPLTLETGDA